MLVQSILTSFMAGFAAAYSTPTPSAVTAHCETETETAYGIVPSGVEEVSWLSSLNSKYFTDGHTWTGSRVPVFTSLYSIDENRTETGLAYLETGILKAEGYDIVSSAVTVTNCVTSPTGDPSETECTPHHDHWHCPPGVEEPSHPPDEHEHEHEHEHESGIPGPSGTECVHHINHWHCPVGVPEPSSDHDDTSASRGGEQEGLGVAVAHHDLFALAVALAATHKVLV